MDKIYFNFFYIPDLIVRKKVSRKDYEIILKVLNKVKKAYIESKVEKQLQKQMEELFAKQNPNEELDYEEEMQYLKLK